MLGSFRNIPDNNLSRLRSFNTCKKLFSETAKKLFHSEQFPGKFSARCRSFPPEGQTKFYFFSSTIFIIESIFCSKIERAFFRSLTSAKNVGIILKTQLFQGKSPTMHLENGRALAKSSAFFCEDRLKVKTKSYGH